MTAQEIIRLLNLTPHPEGGYYRETYRSPQLIPGLQPPRAASTAIYYLLVPGAVSKFHRLKFDEMFHFHIGDPVTWVLLPQEGGVQKKILGPNLEQGETLQLLIPAGTWFGGYLNEGGQYALMGTTVAPGFDFEDFQLGRRDELIRVFPSAEKEIIKLT